LTPGSIADFGTTQSCENQLRGDRRAQRELAVNVAGREAGQAALDEEAAHHTVVDLAHTMRHVGEVRRR
jgi:hypothetical protein